VSFRNKLSISYSFFINCYDQVPPQVKLYTHGSRSCAKTVTDVETAKLIVHTDLFSVNGVVSEL
jgi:hypothetical protein